MASMSFQPPAPFCFNKPDEWLKWKRRFEQFRVASGLSDKSDERQANTLLYCLGADAEDILSTTNISTENRKKYQKVLEKFDEFFAVRRNVIFERARFNKRTQQQGESAEDYITVLHQLAESCEYGDIKEEMIRDRLVVGIRDEAMSERLQMESELTLDKAKKLIRQREAVQQQQGILKGSNETLETINARSKAKSRTQRRLIPLNQPVTRQPVQKAKLCRRCGKSSHPRQSCPAKDATCFRCNRKGHYGSQCLSKTVAEIADSLQELTVNNSSDGDLYSDTVYLNAVNRNNEKQWCVQIQVEKDPVTFKVDTGAEVTAMSETTFYSLKKSAPQLKRSNQTLRGPNRSTLDVLGETTFKLTYKGKSSFERVFVIHNLQHNLLGLPAIKALEIITGINAITQSIPEQYPTLFSGLGTFKREYTIKLRPDAKPFCLFTPRNVPLPLREKVKQEIQRMEKLGVISRIEEPTPWCAAMVIVPKPSGSIRICVDLKPLNESVMREIHPLPKVDTNLAQLTGARLFSKLDTNSGFWQVPLSKESRLLTTFITPYGRFCFNKLPFGIASAPEHFQCRMNEILRDLPGVICHVDDILVSGRDKNEHDSRLHAVMKRLEAAGVTLNKEKCQFSCTKIVFLGHVIDANGISPDPHKTEAIRNMKSPRNVTELRRFMGMINQLNKFSPNIAHLSQPLRELLKATTMWLWTEQHEEALKKLKEEICSHRVLAHYDVHAKTKISADASAYGLGAVLLQSQDGVTWQPVAFASRSLNETELRYAQIEKEALALVYACEKFSEYVLGKVILLETDHKPLVPLLGSKSLDTLPPRVLRFRIRLMRFQYSINHVPGKTLYMADTLSRAPLNILTTDETAKETESFVQAEISSIPASKDYLESYRKAQSEDAVCSKLMEFCRSGWPKNKHLQGDLKKYWQFHSNFSVCNDLLLFGSRIVVPTSKQTETLQKIHQGHQGFQKCRLRVTRSVWWLGITQALENFIKDCPTCQQTVPPQRQPLMSTPLPDHPWEKLATDLFHLNGSNYTLLVDYYSRYVEVQKLTNTTSAGVISFLKANFARYGIPGTLISDNGPQFSSKEFKEFAKIYCFHHITSSPHFPQSNGLAERTVRTMKKLLQGANDPYLALLSYRTTPLQWCHLTPSELLMGRQLKTDVPQTKDHYIPKWPHIKNLKELHQKYREVQSKHYNRRHRVRTLPSLPEDTAVWVQNGNSQEPGSILHPAGTPRSYIVSMPRGEVRRNRMHLRLRERRTQNSSNQIMTRSKTGTEIRPPNFLRF